MSDHAHGFTLVELAIVLVIIGLIVGGVLAGQDLIHAAQIRTVITDVEHYNAAAVTFREKYQGLPGDLINTKATEFGFNTADNNPARNGTANHGDGDGKINGCALAWGANSLGCETVLFWTDLGNAHLISFRSALTSITGDTQIGRAPSQVAGDGIVPKTRISDQLTFMIFNGEDGHNSFGIGQFYTDSGGGVYNTVGAHWSNAFALTPLEAGSIDRKRDDGEPLSGSIKTMALTLTDTPDTTLGTATACTSIDGHYTTATDALASAHVCPISIKSAF